MSKPFFERPILNSPYEYPEQHWEIDRNGQPTQQIIQRRRRAEFLTPIPKPRRQSGAGVQASMNYGDDKGLSTEKQRYEHAAIINGVREQVDRWRQLPEAQWRVTPETARLLKHWRHHEFSQLRPFFCQVEAAETAIWLTEVAPKIGGIGRNYIAHINQSNDDANPDLSRVALKLATGAGKTTVMALLIAWQTVNAVRRPNSKLFTKGFLIVAPGLTIRDRLQVLQPNDPNSYYESRELVPGDMLGDLQRARIVITNYHAFKRREKLGLSKGTRALVDGRYGDTIDTVESEGEMLQRAIKPLMGMKNIMAINDEAHHCYREKPGDPDNDNTPDKLKGDAKQEAKKNAEAARLWISGLEAVQRHIGLGTVFDLSATPFFLSGSGYAEGTLFPWTMSDFSLMDAIECGIVKLPRVPIDDNIPGEEMPIYRNLWEHIRKDMPKKGRGKAKHLDPHDLPTKLQTAIEALYGHYSKTFDLWADKQMPIPPCFIIVCNNTSTSKLVYDYVSGFERQQDDGNTVHVPGRCKLFQNHDEHGNPLGRPKTLLIDSEQLESGDALDRSFRDAASDEIDRFKRERVARTGNQADADNITDQDLLREVMNTVGKAGQLGESIRCVVSVSMLTEGWDANNVTHVLGVRAFGTQLLCEQVVGRALRRESYELNEQGLFNPSYADVLGIPFDFAAEPVIAEPQPPRETIWVHAVRPERDALEIRFPRVEGYRVDMPSERLTADFTADSRLELTPDLIGPAKVKNAGIVGEETDLSLVHTGDMRQSTVLFNLTQALLDHWRESGQEPPLHMFNQLKRVARQWIDECLTCKGGTYPAQLMYRDIGKRACEKITAAITRSMASEERPIKAILSPYNPVSTTAHVGFNTSKTERYQTRADKSHIDWVILDSGWEAEFCRVAENHPRVRHYVKNHNLGFDVPYRLGGENRTYCPDFIIIIDDGHGDDDPLQLIVEIKGYRGEDAQAKKDTMDTYWVPGVNHLKAHGRWAFAEFGDVYEMEDDFAEKIEELFDTMIEDIATVPA
ncbi:BPTD_3080 family restriction endonuclease [Salinisphaera aquimarina]|uniref:BPTD_3080 family restriction endonuclease n=1 Tax=Salinisphaera aquimarina TaxID=2094031 RepID=A0ABV7ET24_9GAMM